MVKDFTFVASWGVLDLRWHGKEYSESEASRTAKSVHKGSRWHELKGLLGKNWSGNRLDRMSSADKSVASDCWYLIRTPF